MILWGSFEVATLENEFAPKGPFRTKNAMALETVVFYLGDAPAQFKSRYV